HCAEHISPKAAQIDDPTRGAALLLNAAMLSGHPAARIILCIAAVELLAARQKWSPAQKLWINDLEPYLDASTELTAAEKDELKPAIAGLKRFGSTEGNRRLIENLGLNEISDRWNKLYSGRSQLVHGGKKH